MTDEEFRQIVSQDSALAGPLKRAAAAADSQQFALGVGEAAALVFMFPIAQFVLTQIGLPWLYEAKRYSELWRLKFHEWIDGQFREAAFDPDKAEAAGDALRKELEKTTDTSARAAWEHLAKLLAEAPGDGGAKGKAGE